MIYTKSGSGYTLESAGFSSGRIQNSSGTLTPFYYTTDHLGSVRLITNNGGAVAEQNDYYPFGGKHTSGQPYSTLASNRYKFNGKEEQTVRGLSYLDYGARMYDNVLGRWMTQDPLGEKYYGISSYIYCFNNPINVIDPDGRDGIYIAFPKYRADGYPLTGHAGVLLINNQTGYTKYYEYGRYDVAEKGMVRTYPISNVVIKNGIPTAESLNAVLSQISKKSGKNQSLEGAYVTSNDFDIMNNYAQKKLAENQVEDRKLYNILTNNCGTFADDVIKQDKNIKAPFIIDPRPVSIKNEYQNNFTPVLYDPNKGTQIQYNNKTVIYNEETKKTKIQQSWWQEWYHGKMITE